MALLCVLGQLGGVLVHGQEAPADPVTTGPAPKGEAWTPAWGFWPKVPQAWQQTFQGQVAQVKKGQPEVIFLGDSITAGWAKGGASLWKDKIEPLHAVNLGIGGDTTRQVLWRLDHGTIDGAKPKLIVMMIGVNNIFTATGSDDEIVRGIKEIIGQLQTRCPEAKILVLGILPLGNSAQSERCRAINGQIAGLQQGPVRFLDMTGSFQGPDGKILPDLYVADQVHLAPPGYEAWWKTMQPVFEEMLK